MVGNDTGDSHTADNVEQNQGLSSKQVVVFCDASKPYLPYRSSGRLAIDYSAHFPHKTLYRNSAKFVQ